MASCARVLIVEDEILISMMLEEMVEDLGHRVAAVANSFHGAEKALEEIEFDVVILDVNLGERSATPIADELDRRSVPIIFATGHTRQSLEERFRDRPVLSKPYDPQSLDAAIRAACG